MSLASRIALLALSIMAACAKTAPPPRTAVPPPPEPPPAVAAPAREDGMSISGTLGTISDDEVLSAFRSRWPDVVRCSQSAQARQSYLTGTVQLKLRIGPDGAPRRAYIERSSLGNYTAERCILEVARALVFAAPRGGAEAEFLFPIEVKPRPSSPYVVAWDGARIAPTVERSKLDAGFCRGEPEAAGAKSGAKKHGHGAHAKAASRTPARSSVSLKPLPPSLALTLYIAPGGKVASAGLQADGPLDEEFATCFVDRAKAWKVDDPRGQIAKTSFEVSR